MSAHVLHVDVGSQPHVVGEIPALVIRVVIDYDLVAVPEPVVGIGQVKWRDAEIEAAKPKAVGTTSCNAPHVTTAEAAGEASMLERMIEVEAGVLSPSVMPDPLAIMVDVRSFWMACSIAIGSFGRSLVWRSARGSRTMRGNVSTTDGMAA